MRYLLITALLICGLDGGERFGDRFDGEFSGEAEPDGEGPAGPSRTATSSYSDLPDGLMASPSQTVSRPLEIQLNPQKSDREDRAAVSAGQEPAGPTQTLETSNLPGGLMTSPPKRVHALSADWRKATAEKVVCHFYNPSSSGEMTEFHQETLWYYDFALPHVTIDGMKDHVKAMVKPWDPYEKNAEERKEFWDLKNSEILVYAKHSGNNVESGLRGKGEEGNIPLAQVKGFLISCGYTETEDGKMEAPLAKDGKRMLELEFVSLKHLGYDPEDPDVYSIIEETEERGARGEVIRPQYAW